MDDEEKSPKDAPKARRRKPKAPGQDKRATRRGMPQDPGVTPVESPLAAPTGAEDVLVLPPALPAIPLLPGEQVELPMELVEAEPTEPAPTPRPPSLYPLRPRGVRPVVRAGTRRGRGAGGLRNDCPPDRRHPLHPPRTRLR